MRMRGFKTVESEIRREKAEALGRAGERLERPLQELLAFRQEFIGVLAAVPQSVPDGKGQSAAEFERKVAEYTRLCEQTRAFRHALIIQREAVGLWGHEDVDRQYSLPGPPAVTEDDPG